MVEVARERALPSLLAAVVARRRFASDSLLSSARCSLRHFDSGALRCLATIRARKRSENNGGSAPRGSFDRGEESSQRFFSFFFPLAASQQQSSLRVCQLASASAAVHSLTCLAARRAPPALACCAPGADLRACERMVKFERKGFRKRKKERKVEKAKDRCGKVELIFRLSTRVSRVALSRKTARLRRDAFLSPSSLLNQPALSSLCRYECALHAASTREGIEGLVFSLEERRRRRKAKEREREASLS